MAPKRTPSAPSTPSKKLKAGPTASPSSPSKGQPKLAAFLARSTDQAETASQGSSTQIHAHISASDAAEESDEAMARRLQAEWDAVDSASSQRVHTEGAPTAAMRASDDAAGASSNEKTLCFGDEPSSSSRDAEPANLSTPASARFDIERMLEHIHSLPLEEDPLSFSADVDVSSWPVTEAKAGRSSTLQAGLPRAPFALFARACELLSATQSRILILAICTNTIRLLIRHDPAAVGPATLLFSNHIAPPHESIELGVGGSIINQAIKETTGASPRLLKQLWDKWGDPGDVAFEARKGVRALVQPGPLIITKVFESLYAIAAMSGSGSQASKKQIVTKLLVACRGEETRFLVRTLISHLRVRAVRTTLASALARAFALDGVASAHQTSMCVGVAEREGVKTRAVKKERSDRWESVMSKLARAERVVREVRARCPDFGRIVAALLSCGIDELSRRVPLAVGTPLAPMLGSITRSLPAMHEKLGDRAFVSEFKYDGQRVQIHCQKFDTSELVEARKRLKGGKGRWVGEQREVFVRLFSRHLEDITDKYPDLCEMMPLLTGASCESQVGASSAPRDVQSFVMDAEVVALGPASELLPFQTLASRGRKDVQLDAVKVRVGIFAFDLMYLDGAQLLRKSFRTRRKLMQDRLAPFNPTNPKLARFLHVQSSESTDPDEVKAFFDEARNSKCEGIMIKSLDHHWESDVALEMLQDDVGEEVTQEDLDQPTFENDVDVGKGVNGRGKALLSSYEPDKRCESWLKVKKDYIEGIGDTLDLVPIAAWHGMGRKNEWWSPGEAREVVGCARRADWLGLSLVLLATYDKMTGQYIALCKCISGFTDAEYKSIKFDRFKEDGGACYSARTEDCRDDYDTGGLFPDVWFEPKEVWEIRGADITLSPVYTVAKGQIASDRGLSLRFPRFIKRRDASDKGPEDATTPEQVAHMYRQQNHADQRAGEEDVEEL
ncbi:ATP-dependent DNA ligase [Ceraceosorus guamensis]|uniref:ATP-dependent DNA ligase n=1 Tax=Ceraceosorus guamensis TaxID=1522189 RepID=A0A316WB01_9BASI|nr:ATP-dependent DNA ligase [Ceraceosorus guamensis]PWN46158.1 ATP-dependent DNA ligase [Ceraceosorus guamensis]